MSGSEFQQIVAYFEPQMANIHRRIDELLEKTGDERSETRVIDQRLKSMEKKVSEIGKFTLIVSGIASSVTGVVGVLIGIFINLNKVT